MEYCNCEEMNYSWGSTYVSCYTYINCIISTREVEKDCACVNYSSRCLQTCPSHLNISTHSLWIHMPAGDACLCVHWGVCVCVCVCVSVFVCVCVYFPGEDFGFEFPPCINSFLPESFYIMNGIESSCKMSNVLRVSVWGLFVWMLLVCRIVFWNFFFPW